MYHKTNNTHVHGIVKKMWIGTFSASATCVCPEQAFIQVSSQNQDFQLGIKHKYYESLDARKVEAYQNQHDIP